MNSRELRNRLDTIRALYSLTNAISTMHNSTGDNPELRKSISDQLSAAQESVDKMLKRLDEDLNESSS